MTYKFEIHKDKASDFRLRFKYNTAAIMASPDESIKTNGPDAPIDALD